ncbi:cyclase family protein [Streptacidiphilus jiangxiensis]|uniref:Kynurenine formamidase n=1 Tax=Streptacidiphilus jiangxiensis TaxID=235985 RepID=A0A1H7NPT1_STRJI|nr:cyclase family protein [Streptacidiphilus jiangxiensis]SEL25028.1 Kynurenine formamidase [Streptacidiphilus jiangxiensis]
MDQAYDDADGQQQWRVQFDADVVFANGGGLQTQGFRLDVPGPELSDDELGELLVRHLGLLMVQTVRITDRRALREAHKGGRGTERAGARTQDRRIVELSHPIRHGMVTCPGLPGPDISDHLSREASRDHYAPGTEFQIGRISMVANTGTYLDSPFHRFADRPDLAGLPLDGLVDLDGLVVRVIGAQDRAVDRTTLVPHPVAGRAVLIHTGWDRHWGSERYGAGGHPFLTAEGATWLAEQRPALVGIDSQNIDDTEDPTRPAHTALLAAGIPVVEHLRGLDNLPVDGFRFHAAPPAVEGLGTFPVRAYAVLPPQER